MGFLCYGDYDKHYLTYFILSYYFGRGLGPNNFSGTLPAKLGGLWNLQQWDMTSSGLSGELPTSLSNLTAMQTLMMSDNNFTGKLPDFIGTWSNLQVLRIQGNSISGPIPSSFFSLFKLNDLRIGDLINRCSSLEFLGIMTNLNTLILRNAKICASLQSIFDFASYTSLVTLDLSFNNITGNIPLSLLSLSSLNLLFLGNNSITGTLPETKSLTLRNIDLSYNQLSGSLPYWVNEPNLALNLVANNFVADNSNNIVLPSGLDCLQRDMPCYRDFPAYYQFAINCGGGANVTSSLGTNFDIDNANLSATSYFVTNLTKWAVSNFGRFIDASINPNANYIISSQIQSQNTLDSKLFNTARMSPSSLRYYGLGLENGNYTVKLQFSEIGIPDQPTWTSLARRVFDIYIQGMLKEKDFDIRKEAGGKSFRVVLKEYQAPVTNNFLEIHLFWAGKGTTFIPSPGYYGPSISAISVSPYDFIPSVSNKPPHFSSSNNNTALVLGIVCGVVVLGLIVSAILVWKHKQKNLNKVNEELLGMTAIPNTFSYSELRTATEDFNRSNFLGEGGFGPVFKGKLHDGRMVAVKQLSLASQQGERQFMAEIATISAVKHRNLAKLYGCCIEGDKRLLVYEYLENKSLDQAIFRKKDLHLDWKTRFEICLGVARGLAYLHEESSVRIIHRDIKSSNILLDGNLTPKISDFGLAKLYDDKWTHISTRVAGTIGYLAPEYAMRGHLTEKADVFGFGIVALEVLSGRRNSDPSLEEEQSYLLDWAWHLYEQKHELDLVDPSLSSFNRDEATRVIGVSLLCIQASPTLRPAMSIVVAMLAGFLEVNEVTSRPSYLTECHFKDISSNLASAGFCKSADLRETNSQVNVPSNPDNVNL
ncbi:probable LRR receptor-like serine/threonine-protein kinase At1g56140 [Dendrobium catenatum]|uniref:probable LRR receptor-like serine/threonine-protein kinase At1g56140 n=1 Tax=Dendrobium catenatum TaxID=906689 RepID=UPI00109F92D6|nr:probable LRR receptor-like serine/threonine-protein kinase At1g56140 [Dendrobium catenatum]